jgi:hypothetical protein
MREGVDNSKCVALLLFIQAETSTAAPAGHCVFDNMSRGKNTHHRCQLSRPEGQKVAGEIGAAAARWNTLMQNRKFSACPSIVHPIWVT